jgi:DNA-binding NarL/FixJ family response regulator
MQVLIADSNSIERSALELAVKSVDGIETSLGVSNLTELSNQLNKFKPDIILLVWNLVKEIAKEASILLKATKPHYLIILGDRKEFEKDALAFGADDFIVKNSPLKRLYTLIDEFIKTKKKKLKEF